VGAATAQAQVQPDAPGAVTPAAETSGNDVIETIAAVVQGLSGDDLLNVRATASPIGLVLARIPNGTMLMRLECSTSRSTEWCRVEVPDLDGLVGWTPARYLRVARSDGEAAEEAPAPLRDPQAIDPSQITVGILPDPLPIPVDPVLAAASGEPDLQTALLSPAGDGPPTFDAAREAEKINGAAADLTLAYATRDDPASSEVYSAVESEVEADETAPASAADEATTGDAADDASALAVPVPSPRPPRESESEPSTVSAPLAAALPSADTDVRDGAPAAPAPTAEETPEDAPSLSTQDVASPAPSVPPGSMTLSVAPPDDLAPLPEGNTASAPSPVAEAMPEDAGGAEPTLREQLAALLPAWSRPNAPVAVGAEPGPRPKDAESAPPVEDTPLVEATPDTGAAAEASTPAEAPEAATEPPSIPVAPVTVAETAPTETDAQALPGPADAAAEGLAVEIPCARYVGQPMTRCEARVLRIDEEDADVTVHWPDGGTRLIRFRGGQPESTNGRGDFRFTREAELSLIRVGSGERFEILDAVPFAE
jgi:hypothetical protein